MEACWGLFTASRCSGIKTQSERWRSRASSFRWAGIVLNHRLGEKSATFAIVGAAVYAGGDWKVPRESRLQAMLSVQGLRW
jgi:hypothetical protein